jgi:hypothetical protein
MMPHHVLRTPIVLEIFRQEIPQNKVHIGTSALNAPKARVNPTRLDFLDNVSLAAAHPVWQISQ